MTGTMTRAAQIAHVRGLLGGRWERGATGPESWDCGSLTAHLQRTLFGRTLPMTLADYAGLSSAEAMREALATLDLHACWPVVSGPWRHGDVILMCRGHYAHVGTWLVYDRPGRMLHAARHQGVIASSRTEMRVQGWQSITACRPAEEMA